MQSVAGNTVYTLPDALVVQSMKKDHYLEVVGYMAVVRAAFAEFVALGRVVPADALSALAAVESWLAGDDIDAEALQAAANLSHEDGVRFEKREKDRSLTWARGAAGNLAWLAKKDRGWQNGGTSVMDAAVYTLSSLGTNGVKEREQFETIRVAAMANAGKNKRPPAKKMPKPLSTNLTEFIGAAANKRLAKLKPSFDMKQRGSDEKLQALLRERGYPVHGAVLDFDRRYGGLLAADAPGEEGYDWLFGAHACLSSSAHSDPRGDDASWVPVAYAPNDYIFYLDGNGVAWIVDTVGDGPTEKFADDADKMMVRIFTAKP
jgi:hypothetical protein